MLAGSRLIVAVAILVGRDNWHDTTARDDELDSESAVFKIGMQQ